MCPFREKLLCIDPPSPSNHELLPVYTDVIACDEHNKVAIDGAGEAPGHINDSGLGEEEMSSSYRPEESLIRLDSPPPPPPPPPSHKQVSWGAPITAQADCMCEVPL